MSDQEWLLRELERWRDPKHAPPVQAQIRAALESPGHQQLASRLHAALTGAAPRPMDWPLPPPC
jgi:hypothetical protein